MLLKKLIEKNYICDFNFAASVAACLNNKPVAGAFLFGPAGTGKTYLAETLAEIENAEKFFFQCFPGTREEDLLMKLIPDENTISGIKIVDGVVMQAVKSVNQGKLTYLILDEWDKTRPSADSFLLDFLQNLRINFNGIKINIEDPQKLRVFITMNDERELSEPLLRRLPMLHFAPLPPHLVREALELTHPNHPFISSAVILYAKSLMAGMSKPATIQELRQLLDAISLLGDNADWDTLVFQFVTKTIENHNMLKSVEHVVIEMPDLNKREMLDPEKYEDNNITENDVITQKEPKMPRMKEILKINEKVESKEIDDFETLQKIANGIIELTDDTYNAICYELNEISKEELDKKIEIINNHIILKNKYNFENINPDLFGKEGEIVLEHKFSRKALKVLQKKGWKIVKISENEILAKYDGIDLRWREDNTEIIVNTKLKYNGLLAAFGLHWEYKIRYQSFQEAIEQGSFAKEIFLKNDDEKPKLMIMNGQSELEIFNRVEEYLKRLFKYFFNKISNYDIPSSYPAKYDLRGWEEYKRVHKKVLIYIRIIKGLMNKYNWIKVNIGNGYSESSIVLDFNKERLLIKYYNKEGRIGNIEELMIKYKETIEKINKHIKQITGGNNVANP